MEEANERERSAFPLAISPFFLFCTLIKPINGSLTCNSSNATPVVRWMGWVKWLEETRRYATGRLEKICDGLLY